MRTPLPSAAPILRAVWAGCAGRIAVSGVLGDPTAAIGVMRAATPTGERIKMRDLAPKATCSEAKQDAAKAMDGNNGTFVRLNLPKPKAPAFVQFEFAQPYAARMLSILPAAGMQGCSGKIEVSDDGQTFRAVESFSMQRGGELRTFAFAPVTAKFYRVLFTSVSNKMKQLLIAEVDFSAKIGVENLVGKVLRDRIDIKAETASAVKPEEVVQGDKIVNLQVFPDGNHGVWVRDVAEGTEGGSWSWPTIA